jgi:hypothetical protein
MMRHLNKREEAAFVKQLDRFDDNVKHAILMTREKDNKTEFTRKLESLNDKISAYNYIFCSKEPSFITLNNKYKNNLPTTSENIINSRVSVNLTQHI